MSNKKKISRKPPIPDIMNMSAEQLANTVVCCGDLDYRSIFVETFGCIPTASEQQKLEELIAEMDLDFHQEVLLEIKFGTEAATLAGFLEEASEYERSYLLDTPVGMLNFDYENVIAVIKSNY